MSDFSEQEEFWAETYAKEYIEKNNHFDNALLIQGWEKMLSKAQGVNSVLECGCNIGRNLGALNQLLPASEKSIIEISKPAYDFVFNHFDLKQLFNGSILRSDFNHTFDLVFTMGVLIHISPDNLLDNMKKMHDYSNKYILMGEYFNRTPVMIEYQGQKNQLFKRDFGKLFVENFNVTLVDYGFLWGYIYDQGGFGDITWWLFEKN